MRNRFMYLCVPVLTNYTGLTRLLESAEASSRKPDYIFIVDNGGKYIFTGNERVNGAERIIVYKPGRNLGVAASWNWCLRRILSRHLQGYHTVSKDYVLKNEITVIISNDDIVLEPRTLEAFETARQDDPSVLVHTNALDSWSLFSQHLRSLDTIGYFDEEFWPAYWEDKDYERRLAVAGIPKVCLPTATCQHEESATIKSYKEHELERKHHRFFRRNQQRYIDKWGGLPGHERYTTPQI